MQIKEAGVGYGAEQNGVLYICPNPILRFSAEFNYHSDTEPAIEWKNGLKVYYLNGVYFKEDLWKKVISKKMSFEEILAIEDIDQRTQAMKYGDVEKFLEFVEAKKLDEHQKETLDGVKINYALWEIPITKKIFTETAYYMLYDCPSTGKKYISGVPKFSKVEEAMAWKIGVSPEDWRNMIPLVSES